MAATHSSPVQQVRFRQHRIFVKRDDLFALDQQYQDDQGHSWTLSGNKARKLCYHLNNEFSGVSRLVSHGSVQSNMLASLAVLAKLKGWRFEFYVDHLPENLEADPRGNYGTAIALSAEVRVANYRRQEPEDGGQKLKIVQSGESRLKQFVEESVLRDSPNTVYIPEGGASAEAEEGLRQLAAEINDWVDANRIQNPKLMLPSGTGTSAYFLQKHLPFEVLTCACVGPPEYLEWQFSQLSNNNKKYPTILPPLWDDESRPRKFQFGKPYREFYQIWTELKDETGIEFDLLYDPQGWLQILAYLDSPKVQNTEPPPTMIYLHQGGLAGNDTMLQRCKRKFGVL